MFGVDSRDTEPARPWYYPLSEREGEIAELIAAGWTNLEIATHFGRRHHTVNVRVAYIMRKLNLERRTDIAAWVAQHRPA